MDGSATPTMDTSSASRHIAPPSTISTPHSRGDQRGLSAGNRLSGEKERTAGAWDGTGRSVDCMPRTVCMYTQYLQTQLVCLQIFWKRVTLWT